jgi:integrase
MAIIAPTSLVAHARLERAWQAYQEVHFPDLARKTRAEYTSSMRLALGGLPRELGPADVIRWHRRELAGRYALSYANQCLHVLRSVVRRAGVLTGDQELVAVVWQAEPIREPALPVTAPPPDLVARSLALCRTPAERLFVRLAGIAGLRRGEILGLQAQDWEPPTGILRVVRQRRSPRRKNRRPHRVEVTEPTFRADLDWTLAHRDALRARTGWWRATPAAWVFPWSLRRAEGLLERLRAALPAGYLPRGRGWHLYRHWGATMLARRGASVWDVMRWLGDSSARMATWYVDTHGAANCDAVQALTATAVLGTMTPLSPDLHGVGSATGLEHGE